MIHRPQHNLRVDVHRDGPAYLVSPAGMLDLASYPRMRDALLKCSAEEPAGVVVLLGGLDVAEAPVLSVFTTVWMRISEWPGTPLALAEPTPRVADLLRRIGVSRFVPTYPDRAVALAALHVPEQRRRVRMQLEPDARSAGRARRAVVDICRTWGLGSFQERAVLVASELVSNALQHAASAPELRLEWTGRQLVVAVTDASPFPPRVLDPLPSAPGGRGLRLVAGAAACWGYTPTTAGGKVVWASLQPEGARRG